MENPRCWGSWRCWPLPTAASLFFLLPPNLDASLLPHSLPCPLIHSPPPLSPSIPLPSQRLPITCNVNFGGFSPFIIWCFAQVMNLFCLSSLSSNSLALIFPSSNPSPPPCGYWIIVCSRLGSLLSFTHSHTTEWPLIGFVTTQRLFPVFWLPNLFALEESPFLLYVSPCREWMTRCLYFF